MLIKIVVNFPTLVEHQISESNLMKHVTNSEIHRNTDL